MQKVTISAMGETLGVFYFETEEEASKFGADVDLFMKYVDEDNPDRQKIMNKYKNNKIFRNFFTVIDQRLVVEEPKT